MLVLCWQPGQVSTIHDHADSLNVTRVYNGSLTSRFFEVDEQPVSNRTLVRLKREDRLKKDDLAIVDRNEIHQLANTSEQKLVTLHIYARPLSNITVYCPNSGQSESVPVRYGLEEDFT